MPHRNVIRQFAPENMYHVYNRGVEKRQIYMDAQDYGVFLNRLKQTLTDPEILDEEYFVEHLKSFYGKVELVAYCLMPNHFHLLLYQHDSNSISEFMRTLSTSYTMYFNSRHERIGSLFQGRYKARLVSDDAYYQHISRYIHLNPYVFSPYVELYPYSSMQFYGSPEKCPAWLYPERGMSNFKNYAEYKRFVTSYVDAKFLEENDKLYGLD